MALIGLMLPPPQKLGPANQHPAYLIDLTYLTDLTDPLDPIALIDPIDPFDRLKE